METTKTIDPIRSYLQEISRYPLLTASEEIELAIQVQLMRNPPGDVSPEELELIKEQGQRAKDKMIRSNLKLVVSIAKKYLRRNMDFLDLIQEGSIGLARGIEKFDPGRGYKLSTYCYWWIRQSITRALAEKSRTIRLPIHIVEKLNLLKKTRRELTQQLGRSPTLKELAVAMESTPEQITWWLSLTKHTTSLSVMVGNGEGTELIELFESHLPTPEDYLESQIDADQIEALLSCCTNQQKEVIALRFGLGSDIPLTWRQVGDRLGISRENARQIHHAALGQIRKQVQIAD